MVASIQSYVISQGTGAGGAGANDGSAVALQAQLARCQQQLGDWQGCASSKTPEGRKIIENLRARIGTLESRVANTAKPTPANTESKTQPPATQAMSTVGGLLNVLA
ncbi:MAG: hypothetical protein ABIZ09_08395 [Rhodoferax sp.]